MSVFRPRCAAQAVRHWPMWQTWCVLSLQAGALGLIIATIVFFNDYLKWRFGGPDDKHATLQSHWHAMHAGSIFSEVEAVALFAGGCWLLIALAGSFYLFPFIHRHGAIGPSLLMGLRVVVASGGIGALCWLSCFFLSFGSALYGVYFPPSDYFAGCALLGSWIASLYLLWIDRAALSAAGDPTHADSRPAVPGPRCQECGYELATLAESASCPECATPLRRSIRFGGLRFTPLLEQPATTNRPLSAELRVWLTVLATPQRFYRHLRVRSDPAPAERSAMWLILRIAGLLAILLAIVLYVGLPRGALYDPFFLTMGVAIVGWYMLGGAVAQRMAISLYILLRARPARLPDVAWARRVLAYERVFLAIAACIPLIFFTLLFTMRTWIFNVTNSLWPRGIFGIPPVLAAIMLVALACGAIVVWRTEVAIRGIRYANA